MNHPGSAQESRPHPSQGITEPAADQIIDNDELTSPGRHPCQQSHDIGWIEVMSKKGAVHHVKLFGSRRVQGIGNKHTNTAV
jgi:desulfoferrodoxin (superoxide reductase-like protein)